MLYAVRCLKSNEDMILALAGQFKQLSHEPEKFRWLNGIRTIETIERAKYVHGTWGAHDIREACPPSKAGVRPFCPLLGPSLKLRTTRSHEENDACQSPASKGSPSNAARHASFGIVGYWLKRQFLHFHKVHLCRSVRPCLWYLPKWEQTSPLVKVFWIPRGMKTIIEEELTKVPLNSSNSCSTGVKTSKTKSRNLEVQKNRRFFFGKSLSLDCVQDCRQAYGKCRGSVRPIDLLQEEFVCVCVFEVVFTWLSTLPYQSLARHQSSTPCLWRHQLHPGTHSWLAGVSPESSFQQHWHSLACHLGQWPKKCKNKYPRLRELASRSYSLDKLLELTCMSIIFA